MSTNNPPDAPTPDPTPSTETQWPPEDYRKWVHSQVANRLLLLITGLTLGLFSAVAVAFWVVQTDRFNRLEAHLEETLEATSKNAIKTDIEQIVAPWREEIQAIPTEIQKVSNDLRATLNQDIKTEVLQNIVDLSDIVDDTRDEMNEAAKTEIEEIVASPDFANQASRLLHDMLDETGAVQDVILMEALERASDTAEPDSVRALALQLYTLLHGGDRTSEGVPPLREMFLDIVTSEGSDSRFPPNLLSIILQFYPLGEHRSEECQPQAEPTSNLCLVWDMAVIQEVLDLLGTMHDYSSHRRELQSFFARIPPDAMSRVVAWIRTTPNIALGHDVLLSTLNSGDVRVLERAIPDVAQIASLPRQPGIRRIALETLSTLDPYAPIKLTTRAHSLKLLLAGASDVELQSAFGTGSLEIFSSERPYVSDDGIVSRHEPLTELLRDSVVTLLRTGARVTSNDNPYGPSQGEEVADWDDVLLASFRSAQIAKGEVLAYAAWSMRMIVDAEHGSVNSAADKMLQAPLPDLFKDELPRTLFTFAVRHASDNAVAVFSREYPDLWLGHGGGPPALHLTRSLVRRSIHTEPHVYRWIADFLRSEPRDQRFADHLLDAVLNTSPDSTPRSRLTAMARTALAGLTADTLDLSLAEILTRELTRRAAADETFWDAAAAVEDSGLLAAGLIDRLPTANRAALSELADQLPWIGTPPDTATETITGTPATVAVAHATPELSAGGNWHLLQVHEYLGLSITKLPEGVELSLMDANRENTIFRTSADARHPLVYLYLQPGSYSLGLRVTGTGPADQSLPVTVSFFKGPRPLTVGLPTDAVVVRGSTDFEFDSGTQSGEAWLAVELDRGTTITVATAPMQGLTVEELDMMDQVFRAFLYSDDPRGHAAELMRERLDILSKNLLAREVHPSSLEYVDYYRFEDLLYDAEDEAYSLWEDGALDQSDVEAFEAALMELDHIVWEMYGNDSDTYLTLLDPHTRNELASNDDVDSSLYSQLSFTSDQSREVLVQVSSCCVQPFRSGERFLLRVVVEPSLGQR